ANVIPNGRYPIGAITITVPANEVDINIHPRKEEVKFLHPRRVEQALQQAVKAALENNVSAHLKKDVTFKSAPTYSQQVRDFSYSSFAPFDTLPSEALRASGEESLNWSKEIFTKEKNLHKNWKYNLLDDNLDPLALSVPAGDVSKGAEDNGQVLIDLNHQQTPFVDDSSKQTSADSYRLIGQYNTTYLLVEKEDGLFLVDQHAAHERILYELFSQRFTEVATIQLLFPHIITLSAQDIDTITPHLDIFTTNGILIEQCASDQLIVQSLPVHLKDQSIADIVKEVISWIAECASLDEATFKKTINHKLQAQMACKAAVKAGDILTQEKMEQLLRDLEKTNNRFSCPHGRPTGWLLSLSEIEKKFRRRI
ncbi:MAG TPA: hypothetical protein VJJ26_02450, partial [Candidatus Babeliales bacterium]|nr:hypothetical protein [Candidatus Babeliales bacterium]